MGHNSNEKVFFLNTQFKAALKKIKKYIESKVWVPFDVSRE